MTLIKSCDIHKTMYYKQCRECLHDQAKSSRQSEKANEKRVKTLEKAKKKALEKKPGISKNPKDWKNTFLCSDGTRVTQAEINQRRSEAYQKAYSGVTESTCHGCWKRKSHGHAHIIAQARCKQLGKTELIWDPSNFFPACLQCNSAIESPNGKNWKGLLNINQCLEFIKLHDPELFTKFELSAVNQERPTI